MESDRKSVTVKKYYHKIDMTTLTAPSIRMSQDVLPEVHADQSLHGQESYKGFKGDTSSTVIITRNDLDGPPCLDDLLEGDEMHHSPIKAVQ